MRLILQSTVAWLNKGSAVGTFTRSEASMGALVAALRKSKLGPQFTGWIEANIEKLMSDPGLQPHRGRASSAKEMVSEAQSPSKLVRRSAEPAQESPSPSPKAQDVGAKFGKAKSSDYRSTFFEANPDLQGQVVVHHAVEQQALHAAWPPATVSRAQWPCYHLARNGPSLGGLARQGAGRRCPCLAGRAKCLRHVGGRATSQGRPAEGTAGTEGTTRSQNAGPSLPKDNANVAYLTAPWPGQSHAGQCPPCPAPAA